MDLPLRRARGRRCFGYSVFAVSVLLWTTAIPRVAQAGRDRVHRRNKGTIVFQNEAFGSFHDTKTFVDAISKARKNKELTRDRDGNWSFYFVAFLKRSAPGSKLNLVWYPHPRRHQGLVDYTEYTVQPGATALQAMMKLTQDQGFKPDNSYDALITRLVGGKEIVYARRRVTLR